MLHKVYIHPHAPGHTHSGCVITGNIKFDKYNFEQKAAEMTPFMLDAVSNTFKTIPIEA